MLKEKVDEATGAGTHSQKVRKEESFGASMRVRLVWSLPQVVSFEQDTSDSGNGSVSSALRLGAPLKCSLMPGLQAGRSWDATLGAS